jgi:hypothetical protein
MSNTNDCPFCKIVKKEFDAHIIWEDEKHLAFLSIYPNTKGFTVVITKDHYPSYNFDLPDNALSSVENLELGSVVYTDSSHMYTLLKGAYIHESVNHEKDEYVRGDVHTNSIEGFWSLFKRGIYGIYHQVSPKHLQRYCDEFEYRCNTRKIKDSDRFSLVLTHADGRLKYKDLIKRGEI